MYDPENVDIGKVLLGCAETRIVGCRLPGDVQGPWCSLQLLSTNQQNLPAPRLTGSTLVLWTLSDHQ